ncbi:MAG: DnaT-like ssDNA-binding protein [Sphingomonas sp.]
MALIVETGSASTTAESFASVAAADTRHSANGNAAWAALATTAIKEQSLRRATQYMEQAYRTRWHGLRKERLQALSWPRNDVVIEGWSIDSDVVPPEVVNACIDLALKAATATLAPDLERAIVREKAGPLETEYSEFSPQVVRYRAIDMALAPFLRGSAVNADLLR